MEKNKTAEKTISPTLEMSALEKDLINIGRILDEEGQALAYRYQYYLASKLVMSSDPIERVGKDLIFATPNSDVWRELSPEIMSSTADVLLLAVNSEYVSASVYEYAEKQPKHLYLTYDNIEVLELIENALGSFEKVPQDQFEEYQRTYSTGIRELSSHKGGSRI
ncbi:MAG: hypothetical protein AAGU32_22915 [Bacillota bacterium]